MALGVSAAVGGRVTEAIRAVVVGLWCVGERPIAIQFHRPVIGCDDDPWGDGDAVQTGDRGCRPLSLVGPGRSLSRTAIATDVSSSVVAVSLSNTGVSLTAMTVMDTVAWAEPPFPSLIL